MYFASTWIRAKNATIGDRTADSPASVSEHQSLTCLGQSFELFCHLYETEAQHVTQSAC